MSKLFLKVKVICYGMHPDERCLELLQADGSTTQTFAWKQQIMDDSLLEVNPIIDRQDGATLVQLPQETCSGSWRVWINPDQLLSRIQL